MNKILSNSSISDINQLRSFFHNESKCTELNRVNSVRITRKLGQELLLNNHNVTVDGLVKWFKIKNLGLDVCQVELNNETRETIYE